LLLERAHILKPQYNEYVIDELTKSAKKTVLRLPPCHCELNPIELAWASIKNYERMNNRTFKINDVKTLLEEGIERVTTDMWKNFFGHVIKVEETSHILTITGDTTDSDSDSN